MTEGLPKVDQSELSSPQDRDEDILANHTYELWGRAVLLCPYFKRLNDDEANQLMLTIHRFGESSIQVNNMLLQLDKKYNPEEPEPQLSEGMQELLNHD